ncbi:hypothetical protein DASC09_042490 [Saccharomycopsis crataegensis]|uniref:Uncharacterized protein n=1 Tax=Saccharomycopsis crataegensis TaxID=43959 RepID=A0AAV5QQA1_9ASCO|nr:hypothetical protein DASC09_042490 [Saccharomycopsis crataegensis]
MRFHGRKKKPSTSPSRVVENPTPLQGSSRQPSPTRKPPVNEPIDRLSAQDGPYLRHPNGATTPSPTRRSPSPRKIPPVPIEQQILAEIEVAEPLKNIHYRSPTLTQFTSNKFKKKLVKELVNEPIEDDEEEEGHQVKGSAAHDDVSSYGLKCFRDENPNFRFISQEKLESLKLFPVEHYPSMSAVPTRFSHLNVSKVAITNVTEVGEFDYLFDNRKTKQHMASKKPLERPHSVASFSSLESGSKLKKFSTKAKRFSQIADQKLTEKAQRRFGNHMNNHHHLRPELSSMPTNNSLYLTDTNSSVSDLAKISQLNTQLLTQQQNSQFFIKYHVFLFDSTRMILSTNPDRKHVYCKYAPGFTVNIQHPRLSHDQLMAIHQGGTPWKKSDEGFRLVLKVDGDEDSNKPMIVVTKKSKLKGNGYVVWLLRRTILNENKEVEIQEEHELNEYWQREMVESPFYDAFQNSELRNAVRRADTKKIMNRYEINDFNELKWIIGSIPKVKSSNFSKFKNYSKDLLTEGAIDSKVDGSKISHKYDVFFFTQNNTIKNLNVTLPETTGNNKYGVMENKVLAMFRPHETKARKRLVKDLKRFKNKTSDKFYINNSKSSYDYNPMNPESIEDDFNNDDASSMNTQLPGYEESKREIFYQPGDGIVMKNTPDDSPSNLKMGWLTIYNESCLATPGMFELVLGLTLAVGYERVINMQNERSEEIH